MLKDQANPTTEKNQPVESRILRLKCADGSRINGSVNINRFSSDQFDRASDVLTKNTEQFIVMYNVTVDNSDYETPLKYKSLLVNREYIVWAEPDEGQ